MTVKQLIKELQYIELVDGNKEVEVWLPGTYISLHGKPMVTSKGTILIEGNVRSGG